MPNRCERETVTVAAVPLAMSPKSRRRAEYAVKQLQTGMMGRARSTITSLADIWKSKSDVGNKVNPNRRTLDVLNVWSRQRRSASATRSPDDVENNKILMENNNQRNYRGTSFTNLNCVPDSGIPNGRHTMNGSSKENGANKVSAAQKPKKKSIKHFPRIKSCEFDDDLVKSDPRRSSEENRNHSNGLSGQERRQRSWFRSSSDEDSKWSLENGKISNLKLVGKQETIVKARLKFQKFKANDDIVLNKTTEMIRPGILYRQNSAAPMLTNETIDLERKPPIQTITKKCLKVDEPKPRKKLSFREPVVSSQDYENFKSKTLPKAEYLLEQYSRRRSIVREEYELDDLKLEVFICRLFSNWSTISTVRFTKNQIKNL